jgi:dTDP-4-amino-4,6-dideoxygalactose transaminase
MTISRVPFTRVAVMGREIDHVNEAIRQSHLSGDGPFSRRVELMLHERLGARTLLTSSCTHALEMSAMLLDIGPGDEVILPSFTFVSTANAFVLRGAVPVFVDSRADTLNIDEAALEAALTPRTRAIVVMHYAGIACAMDAILGLAERHGVPVVEDNAHGLAGRYRGRLLGTLGAMSTASFHETKNFSCGEGGALVLNDSRYVARAEIIREKGTDRSRFFRGEVDKYTWVDIGSSYLMSELQAAFLLGQLENESRIQEHRRDIWTRYHRELAAWAEARDVRQPVVPADSEPSWHLYFLIMPTLERRQQFIAHMQARGVSCVFHYLPLHRSSMGRRYGERALPVVERAADQLVRLPMFNDMSDDELSIVLDAALSWR